ncbi:GNAT family N-acetyltransferase [Bacillus carboniphilus]|uniref:Lysine N-acyltransferase MbtK n=1 Tax=Bacillus carboniphilus TaxID=86663 RepID=A0ABY9JUP8_9BACI|nr:GNAT family N-acetyltransferase [Bacillus carboniphilus]WLR43131.1 GNAT family N-acetyltransferase [Bacillus carboniphilus]
MLETTDHHDIVIYDHELGKVISFRPVDYNRDLHTLHEWMHQRHIAPFWKLDVPLEEFKEYLQKSLQAEHKRIFMGFINDEPVCYVIAYSVMKDPIKDYYDARGTDLGMHLLVGSRKHLNRLEAPVIIRSMILFLLERFSCERIIGEPDIRNRIVIPILTQYGGRGCERN